MKGNNQSAASPFFVDTRIQLMPGGKPIQMNQPVCRNGNRLYLPLGSFTRACGNLLQSKNQKITAQALGTSGIPNHASTLSRQAVAHRRDYYLPLNEICRLFSLQTVWHKEKSAIALYQAPFIKTKGEQRRIGRPALIRFEDLAAGGEYLQSGNLEKLRVIGCYLEARGIPFHLAWIPRFVDPPNGIDNDISKKISFQNAEFLYTLDHLISCGGLLGLHGYTHQTGDDVSGEGTEFSTELNHTEPEIRQRIEAALTVAKQCALPVTFFESPHYTSDAFQQSIIEQYFDIIYEGYVGIWGEQPVTSPRNNRTLYVPTPLGYVEGENGLENLLERIQTIPDASLASLFYHVYAEFDWISRSCMENGAATYTYYEDSPLHRILDTLFEKGCSVKRVTNPAIVEIAVPPEQNRPSDAAQAKPAEGIRAQQNNPPNSIPAGTPAPAANQPDESKFNFSIPKQAQNETDQPNSVPSEQKAKNDAPSGFFLIP